MSAERRGFRIDLTIHRKIVLSSCCARDFLHGLDTKQTPTILKPEPWCCIVSGTTMPPPSPIFDGHNDTLLRLLSSAEPVASFRDCAGAGQLDLVAARKGGLAGGLFACFVPPDGPRDAGFSLTSDGYTVEMSKPPTLVEARRQTDAMIACAHRLQTELPGQVAVCLDVTAIRQSLADGVLAMVLHWKVPKPSTRIWTGWKRITGPAYAPSVPCGVGLIGSELVSRSAIQARRTSGRG